MKQIDIGPNEYRSTRAPKVRYTPTEWLSFRIASWWATQERDKDFEARQMNAIMFGLGTFFIRKITG